MSATPASKVCLVLPHIGGVSTSVKTALAIRDHIDERLAAVGVTPTNATLLAALEEAFTALTTVTVKTRREGEILQSAARKAAAALAKATA